MCKPAFKEIATDLSMELFHEAREKGFDYQDLADFVGGTKLSMKAYHYGDSTPSLAVFIGIWKKVKPEKVLKKMANWSGYVVIKLPKIDHQYSLISRQTAKVMRETADVIEAVGKALEDGKLTEPEKRTVVKEIDEAIEELLKLKHSIEVER